MCLEQLLQLQLVPGTHTLGHKAHRVDVREHLRSGDVFDVPAQLARRLGAQQPACADLQALDSGRGDGLRAQQDAGQRLGSDQRGRLDVQARDRDLRLCHVGRDISAERYLSACQ